MLWVTKYRRFTVTGCYFITQSINQYHTMIRFFTSLVMSLLATFIFAQKPVFQGHPHENSGLNSILSEKLQNWEVYQVDAPALDKFVKAAGDNSAFVLEMGDHQWDIALEKRDILSANFVLSVLGDQGVERSNDKGGIMTYRGQLPGQDGWKVALTLDEQFIYGYFNEGEETYFIEPLWYFVPGQPKDLYIVYAASAANPNDTHQCGSEEMYQKIKELKPEHYKKWKDAQDSHQHDEMHQHGPEKLDEMMENLDPEVLEKLKKGQDAEKMMVCYSVSLAQAADLSMFNFHGSVNAVQAYLIGLMNDVQTNYDTEFSPNEIQFIIVEQFIVSPPATDPWPTGANGGALLDAFTTWGPGGFFSSHDIGQLITKRNTTNGIAGIAWVNSVCSTLRYHVVWQWSSNSSLMRVTTAHEIGHNFGAGHDGGSGFIMSPTVNNTNAWSTNSVNVINGNLPSFSCLGQCGSSQPPVALFTANPTSGCTPLTVQYTDQSTNSPNTWSWSFPGGTPASSTVQDPVVVYNNPGTFSATLTVGNNVGSNTLTQTNLITVQATPQANFNTTDVGPLSVLFTNTSLYGTSYLWNFGDGNTSTQFSPTHTYTVDGFYDVTLTVTNNCGSETLVSTIPVFTAPLANFTASPTSGCPTLVVNFQDQSSPNTLNWSWSFPGGSPATSIAQNPTITYASPGTYSVTLTASNPAGNDIEVRTDFIVVGTTPTANFTSAVNGATVTFTNTTSNPAGSGSVLYQWDFGDGNSSTSVNPTHTYSASGTYTVSLTATNTCGSNIKTQQVTILLPPVASFTGTPTSGCTPLTVQFTSTSQGATTYSWSFPGGTPSTSTAANPSIVYNTVGSYNVSLTVTNAAGNNTATQTNYITTNTTATAGYTSAVNGSTATFTNTSTNATSYSWNFGDGSPASTETNPSHTYTADGTYTVVLSAINPCGTVTTSQTVTIVTPPTAAFNATPTSGCAPLTVQFNNQSSSNATSWSWSFPGGTPATSTAQNPTVVYNTTGVYNVSMTATNSAGSNTATQTNYITVNTTATAGFTSAVNGNTANFTNTSTNATSYSWNFGDGSPANTQVNPSHTYMADGTYTVVLSAINACGTVTTSQTVTIVTPPTAAFTATPTSGCGPLTVQFTNQSSSNATSWSWSFAGGTPATSTAQNPTVIYNTPGSYSVTLTASNSAGSNTATQTNYINVQAGPSAGYTVAASGNTANFTNTSTNATSYSWNFGDGTPASTMANPSHTYSAEGTYTVVLTATGPCGTSTSSQQVIISSSPVAAFTASPTTGCAPLTVQFQDQSSSSVTAWSWSFPGGTPSTSTAENPTVVYSTPGSYNVSLTVSNALGQNTATQTNYIVVGAAATANFTSATNLLTANFTNTSTNANSYSWNFGDGSPASTMANPSHNYAMDGTYTVVLTATNACGSVTSSQTVTVATMPTAGFTANVTSGCAPLSVQFTNQSSPNATSYAWSFPGGTPSSSTAQHPTVVYNTAGTYSVTLTVSNAAGQATASQMNYITVNAAPVSGFTGSVVGGVTVNFNNTTTNGTSYSWNFGDGSPVSTETNPTHTYATDGVYTVTLMATNACGTSMTNGQFTIVTPPTANFAVSPTSGCAPLQVTYTNQSSPNATSFAWSFPGGTPATSTDQNPVVTYNAGGTYSATLTVSNAAGNSTFTLTDVVTVNTAPTASFTSNSLGGQVAFTNTSSNADEFKWDFGDGSPTSSEENPVHTYTADGTYTVTLTTSNECGETVTTSTVVVSVSGAPVAFFTAENNQGCAPLTVTFNNESQFGETFLWTFQGGTPATSTEENPTVVFSAPGSFDVSLTVTNSAGSNTYSAPDFVVVNTVPTPSFTSATNFNVVMFTNTSGNASSYSWDFGDGSPASTEANPVHTYAVGGQYEVTLTTTNECGFNSVSTTVTAGNNSTWDIPGISRFEVFPNPNDGHFTLLMESASQTEALQISFTNVLGQVLSTEKADFRTGRFTKEFSYNSLAAGVYILQVKSGEKAMFKKLVIE